MSSEKINREPNQCPRAPRLIPTKATITKHFSLLPPPLHLPQLFDVISKNINKSSCSSCCDQSEKENLRKKKDREEIEEVFFQGSCRVEEMMILKYLEGHGAQSEEEYSLVIE